MIASGPRRVYADAMFRSTELRLDDLLVDWFCWSEGDGGSLAIAPSPMFSEAQSGRQYQEADQVAADSLHELRMEALEFCVNGNDRMEGALQEPYRTAISFHARNLHTGLSVWSSPRLPQDPLMRSRILEIAGFIVTRRLRELGALEQACSF